MEPPGRSRELGEGFTEAVAGLREQLLDALYRSLQEVPAWRSFLDALCRALRCDLAAIVVGTPEAGQIVQISDAPAEEQGKAFAALNDPDLARLVGSERLARREWLGGQSLVLTILDGAARCGMLVLWRPEPGDRIGDAEAAILQGLSPALVRATRIFQRISQTERRKIVLETALETSRIGVILATGRGEVMLTNETADRILAEADGLYLSGGRIRAGGARETAELVAELQRNAQGQGAQTDWDAYTPIALLRSHHAYPLTLIVRPGPAFSPLREPMRRTAMLILRDPASLPAVPAASLARLFGLTPAEAALASALARGSDLERAAATFGVSRHTVRSQLQRIFLKTGTKRQGELIRVLLSSAAMSIHSPEQGA